MARWRGEVVRWSKHLASSLGRLLGLLQRLVMAIVPGESGDPGDGVEIQVMAWRGGEGMGGRGGVAMEGRGEEVPHLTVASPSSTRRSATSTPVVGSSPSSSTPYSLGRGGVVGVLRRL